MSLKVVRCLQRRGIEPRPIAAAGDQRISELITEGAVTTLHHIAAMQQDDGVAGRLAALLPIHHVALVEPELAPGERLDLRIEVPALDNVHASPPGFVPAASPIY